MKMKNHRITESLNHRNGMSTNHSVIRLFGDSVIRATRKGFTLIELLVVIGIMGLLGTVSVGGYNAMQRGMEERGVMQNVNTFIRTAYERAQIDRQPTAIYFWNETIRSSTLDENEIVVGKAVAVRRSGRISMVYGDLLVDEFADLERSFSSMGESGGGEEEGNLGANGENGSSDGENTMFLYRLDNQGSAIKLQRSVVYDEVAKRSVQEIYMQGRPSDNVGNGEIDLWGFRIKDRNGVDWKNGSAYGFEFAEITLPHNYIFGSDYSTTAENPVKEIGTMVFSTVQNTGSSQGANGGVQGNVTVYALRPDGSGGLTAQRVGTNDNPY